MWESIRSASEMNDLDRIEHQLQSRTLNHDDFERFAQDQLSTVYPGFTPIGGGTDWGRDGDVASSGGAVPTRVLITSSRTLDGVRKNMLRGIKSMDEHGVAFDRIVLANPAQLNTRSREKLAKSAQANGARLDASDVFDQTYFASRLRRDGYWREKLLGLSAESISLTRIAPDVAENPWAHIPLVARDEDRQAIEIADDMIVFGPPGVGKSRLLGELDGVAFVDPDLSSNQIARDLRWLTPSTVVVDDASLHVDLVRRLVALRRAEPDLFRYRLICTSWPGDVEGLADVLPGSLIHEVGLLERPAMDELLRSMGVSGELARAEIMNQAEGRPGWAVALADALLRSPDSTSLVNGRALLGNVRRYLQRTGVPSETMDLFAVMSAIGMASETELSALAGEVGIKRAEAARVLERWAKGGLVEVVESHEWGAESATRRYQVRPPMLARVLVAERAFGTQFPVLDFNGLVERWPDRSYELAEAAIDSVLLGSATARPFAKKLAIEVLTGDSGTVDKKIDLAIEYARLGLSEAEFVVGLARSSFDELMAVDSPEPWVVEPLVKLVSTVVQWYPDVADGYALLLDACTSDERAPHSHPGSAIRKIADLVQHFHPEIPRNTDARYRVLAALELWLDEPRPIAIANRVASAVAEILLGLSVDASHSDPANPMTIRMYRGVVPPDEMRRVYDEVVPRLEGLLDAGFVDVVVAMAATGSEWLRIGGGYERSFGQKPSGEQQETAYEIGRSLVSRLAGRVDLSLAGVLKLRSLVANFDLRDTIEIPPEIEPIVREVSFRSSDFEGEEGNLTNDIRSLGTSWADDLPEAVAERLVRLRAELERGGLTWPNRIGLVCEGIAEATETPVLWLDAFAASGLLPDAFPFAQAAFESGDLGEERLQLLLQDSATRPSAVWMLLQADGLSAASLLEVLTSADYHALWILCLRGEIDLGVVRQLLTSGTSELRAMVAVAFFAGRHDKDDWSPGALEKEWLDALRHLRPARQWAVRDFELERLFEYLARTYPDVLVELVDHSIREAQASGAGAYAALPHHGWDRLQFLPPPSKSKLRNAFLDDQLASWILNRHLVGTDTNWLEQAIDAGEMSVETALSYCGDEVRPPIEDLAKALVPRGASPESVAAVMQWGTFMGERSDHYQAFVDTLTSLLNADDVDPNVEAVAEAGIAMFTAARDAERVKERAARVRGEL